MVNNQALTVTDKWRKTAMTIYSETQNIETKLHLNQ